ncbi:MAG: site-specific DNA-methyltransferase [Bacteroidales bacterium]|nr:site-specific DNA-methyltransferase [Bacteroidales bacterium]
MSEVKNLSDIKKSLIAEINKRVEDRVLEPANAQLLEKLINGADSDTEAINIAALGTTYKRTGLHFDKRLEKISSDIHYFKKNNDLSFFTDNDKPMNKLIIGDNYQTLQNLLIEYKGKIDVIYIDPPYGKDSMGEFAQTNYQNNITRDNLLSMLYPRLQLAKQLLSDSGVIFCSIDDKNQAYVKCLFDEVFGENNFICNFCYLQSGTEYNIDDFSDTEVKVLGANLGMFKGGVEYILCYKRSKDFKFALRKSEQNYIDSRITNRINSITTLKFPKGLKFNGTENQTFKDLVGGSSERIEILNEEGMVFKNGILQNDVVLRSCFRNPNMVQRFFAGEEVIDNRGQKVVEIYFTSTGIPYMRREKAGDLPTNVLSGFGDTSIPRQILIDILGDQYFDYPNRDTLIVSLTELQ